MITIFLGLLGLIVGAVSVHIAEAAMAHRKPALPGCPYCTMVYRPVQWIALIALLTGQGNCAHCGKRMRTARVIGELYVALSWALLGFYYGDSPRLWISLLATIPLAMVVVTDLESKLIPNVIILPSIVLMLLVGTVFGPALPSYQSWPWWASLGGALVGCACLRILIWIGVAVFGPGALGEGDMTLATYVGALVGFPIIVQSLLLTIILGGVGAILVLVAKKGSMKTAMPYGPYIALGATVCMLWGSAILKWYLS
ncbi:MAG: A24 family peptidase [Anaerolineae bacterium]|nr:A24 family peptidase [Anaerolineae bacterium]